MPPRNRTELAKARERGLLETRHDVGEAGDLKTQEFMAGAQQVIDKLVTKVFGPWSR